jgi:DNA/RNA endonuclease YhcR with UshA esterase domain
MNQNLLSGTSVGSNDINTIQLHEGWQIPRNILSTDELQIIKGLIVIYLEDKFGTINFVDFKRTGETLKIESYDLNEKLNQVRGMALAYSEIKISE